MRPIAVVDTETTGLLANRRAVPWEIAVVLQGHRDNLTYPDGEYCWQISLTPWELDSADVKALEVGHFEERYRLRHRRSPEVLCTYAPKEVRGGPRTVQSRKELAEALVAMLNGVELWASNPQFDAVMLTRFLTLRGTPFGRLRYWLAQRFDTVGRRLPPAEPWHYHLYDVASAVRAFTVAHHLAPADAVPGWSSPEMAGLLDVPLIGPGERHTALGDARYEALLLRAVGILPEPVGSL